MAAADNGSRKDEVRFIASIVLFIVLMGLAMPVAHELGFDGLRATPFLLPAIVALFWMGREGQLRGQRRGCATPATIAYNRRMIPTAILYMVAIVFAVTVQKHGGIQRPLAYVVALLPALPVLGMIWIMARFFVEEDDEYQRARMARRGLMATGFALTLTTIWGFLEQFELVVHLPSYWTFIVWCIGLGVAPLWDRFR